MAKLKHTMTIDNALEFNKFSTNNIMLPTLNSFLELTARVEKLEKLTKAMCSHLGSLDIRVGYSEERIYDKLGDDD